MKEIDIYGTAGDNALYKSKMIVFKKTIDMIVSKIKSTSSHQNSWIALNIERESSSIYLTNSKEEMIVHDIESLLQKDRFFYLINSLIEKSKTEPIKIKIEMITCIVLFRNEKIYLSFSEVALQTYDITDNKEILLFILTNAMNYSSFEKITKLYKRDADVYLSLLEIAREGLKGYFGLIENNAALFYIFDEYGIPDREKIVLLTGNVDSKVGCKATVKTINLKEEEEKK